MRSYQSPAPEGAPEFNPVAGIEFELDGVKFTCQGVASLLESSVLASAAAADQGLDGMTAESRAAVADFLRMALGDAEFQRFRTHCRTHKTSNSTQLDVMIGVKDDMEDNAEREAERPTISPSSSSTGRLGLDERTSRIIGLQSGDISLVQQASQDGEQVDPARAAELADQAAMRAQAKRGTRTRRPKTDAASKVTRVG